MNKKLRKILNVLLAFMVAIVVYIVLHELGHLIVMLSAGAKITEFSILTAHVTSEGGKL